MSQVVLVGHEVSIGVTSWAFLWAVAQLALCFGGQWCGCGATPAIEIHRAKYGVHCFWCRDLEVRSGVVLPRRPLDAHAAEFVRICHAIVIASQCE
jgi:hypothetical protein